MFWMFWHRYKQIGDKYGDLQNSHFSINCVFVLLPHPLHTKSLRFGRKNCSCDDASIAFFISVLEEEERSLTSNITDSPPFSSLSIEIHSLILDAPLSSDKKSLPFNVNPCE